MSGFAASRDISAFRSLKTSTQATPYKKIGRYIRTPFTRPYAAGMSFWTTQDERRARSLREVPTAALRAGIGRAEAHLAELALPGVTEGLAGALEAWLRAVEVLTRALLRLERVLVRAERHNARVEAKRLMLEDGAARDTVREEIGEGALAAWEAHVAELAGEPVGGLGAPPLARLGGLRVRGLAPIGEVGLETYRGEAGFCLPTLPARGEVPATRKARAARKRRELGRRNWMAGIPVWPCELRRAHTECMARRRAGQTGAGRASLERARWGRFYATRPARISGSGPASGGRVHAPP